MATEIILGPPGTGKTTALLNIVDDYLSKGGNPSKVGFISFTKKAVTEAKDRAIDRFNLPGKDFPFYRTLHSLCFYMMGMSSAMVMQRKDYQEMGAVMGMRMSGIHRQEMEIYDMPEGDQLVFLESLSRLRCETLKETYDFLGSELDFLKLEYFRRTLDKYKKAHLLYDFTDMLQKYMQEGGTPELDLLIIDEAQDLCRLQWEIVEKLSKTAVRTYIAGDDDQAIFRWSGADVDYFLNLPKRFPTKILGHSYRLPKRVHALSQMIVEQIAVRNKKEFTCTAERGEVLFVNDFEQIDISTGQWLVLVRNSFLMNPVVELLRQNGFPYQTQYYSVQNDEGLKAAHTWENMRAERCVLLSEAKLCLGFLGREYRGKGNLEKGARGEETDMQTLLRAGVLLPGCEKKIWHEALVKISDSEREFYIAARRRGEKLFDTPRIKVSTIHGAKGGECENVVLFTDMSLKTYRGYEDNPDDEARVFYVGATRAKKNLFIVQPQTKNYYQI